VDAGAGAAAPPNKLLPVAADAPKSDPPAGAGGLVAGVVLPAVGITEAGAADPNEKVGLAVPPKAPNPPVVPAVAAGAALPPAPNKLPVLAAGTPKAGGLEAGVVDPAAGPKLKAGLAGGVAVF
jgi:hypothetical protein